MEVVNKPLLDVRAADLMSRDVVKIPQSMSLRAAAHLLAKAGVSGAPVTDNQGRCIGVLSTTDLLRWLDGGNAAAHFDASPSEEFCSEWQVEELEELPVDEVKGFMTCDVVRASPEARIGELAQSMIDARIHRVIVADPEGKPIGVVSSMDILAAVAAEDRRDNDLDALC
jgi:CBS-domain-containing membrane protein